MLVWAHIASGRADTAYLSCLTPRILGALHLCSFESLTQLAQMVLATTTKLERQAALNDSSSLFYKLRAELVARRHAAAAVSAGGGARGTGLAAARKPDKPVSVKPSRPKPKMHTIVRLTNLTGSALSLALDCSSGWYQARCI